MARKSKSFKESFNPPMRNRGEELNEPNANYQYDYMQQDQYTDRAQERAIRRHEARAHYDQVYVSEQRRDQRAFERLKDMENEFYAGVDPRRRQELADGGMIREDLKGMANLPRQAIHCEFPQAPFYSSNYIDATERGVDEELDDNNSSMARYLNPYSNNNKKAY